MPSKKRKYEARFPPARIKKIMQTDEEIGKVAAAVPVIISRSLEIFLQSLVETTAQYTNERKAKTMTTSHLKHCIENEGKFDFLKDLVANIADIANDEDDTGEGAEKPKKQRKPRQTEKKKRKKESSSEEDSDGQSDGDETGPQRSVPTSPLPSDDNTSEENPDTNVVNDLTDQNKRLSPRNESSPSPPTTSHLPPLSPQLQQSQTLQTVQLQHSSQCHSVDQQTSTQISSEQELSPQQIPTQQHTVQSSSEPPPIDQQPGHPVLQKEEHQFTQEPKMTTQRTLQSVNSPHGMSSPRHGSSSSTTGTVKNSPQYGGYEPQGSCSPHANVPHKGNKFLHTGNQQGSLSPRGGNQQSGSWSPHIHKNIDLSSDAHRNMAAHVASNVTGHPPQPQPPLGRSEMRFPQELRTHSSSPTHNPHSYSYNHPATPINLPSPSTLTAKATSAANLSLSLNSHSGNGSPAHAPFLSSPRISENNASSPIYMPNDHRPALIHSNVQDRSEGRPPASRSSHSIDSIIGNIPPGPPPHKSQEEQRATVSSSFMPNFSLHGNGASGVPAMPPSFPMNFPSNFKVKSNQEDEDDYDT